MTEQPGTIPSADYTTDYFLNHCDGYEAFLSSTTQKLPDRLAAVWDSAEVESGMSILDIGCGRGELVLHAALRGAKAVGLDYASAGLALAAQNISTVPGDHWNTYDKPSLLMADATTLPFKAETFDRAIMSDIVEHLSPLQLSQTLGEVHRALKPGGRLIIHTMPNLWYYRYGYPIYRLFTRMRGTRLPSDPRQRHLYSHVHINEQTPLMLKRALRKVGFRHSKVWLHDYRDYQEQSKLMGLTMRGLTRLFLTRPLFCDDIFALAIR